MTIGFKRSQWTLVFLALLAARPAPAIIELPLYVFWKCTAILRDLAVGEVTPESYPMRGGVRPFQWGKLLNNWAVSREEKCQALVDHVRLSGRNMPPAHFLDLVEQTLSYIAVIAGGDTRDSLPVFESIRRASQYVELGPKQRDLLVKSVRDTVHQSSFDFETGQQVLALFSRDTVGKIPNQGEVRIQYTHPRNVSILDEDNFTVRLEGEPPFSEPAFPGNYETSYMSRGPHGQLLKFKSTVANGQIYHRAVVISARETARPTIDYYSWHHPVGVSDSITVEKLVTLKPETRFHLVAADQTGFVVSQEGSGDDFLRAFHHVVAKIHGSTMRVSAIVPAGNFWQTHQERTATVRLSADDAPELPRDTQRLVELVGLTLFQMKYRGLD